MKNSADLRGYYLTQPLASVDNTLLVLQNSSYPTQPHSIKIIANYSDSEIERPALPFSYGSLSQPPGTTHWQKYNVTTLLLH